MRVRFSNTWLAPGGLEGTVGANWNGQQVNDDAEFFRAVAMDHFGRTRATTFGFRVQRFFSTERAAIRFAGGHFGTLPKKANLDLFADDDDPDSVDAAAQLAGAVLESCRPVEIRGCALVMEYAFKGGLFVAGEDVAPPIEGDDDLMKVGIVNLAMGDESKAVAFDTPFSAAPRGLTLALLTPSGGASFDAVIDDTSRTDSGFTVHFAGVAVPAAGYKLSYTAVL